MDTLNCLLDQFAYNVGRKLDALIEGWVEDLDCGDPKVELWASDCIQEALGWRYKPPERESMSKRVNDLEVEYINSGKNPRLARKLALVEAGSQRRAGRPKTMGPYAVQAYSLYLQTNLTWRQIVEKLKGACDHRCSKCGDVRRKAPPPTSMLRPRKPLLKCNRCDSTMRPKSRRDKVCWRCADALRKEVDRLKAFLAKHGYANDIPRRTAFDMMSVEQLEQKWPCLKKGKDSTPGLN